MCIPREKRTMSHTVTCREKKSNPNPRINIKQQRSVGNQLESKQATTAAAVAAKVNVRMRRKKSAEAAAVRREKQREIGNHHYTH